MWNGGGGTKKVNGWGRQAQGDATLHCYCSQVSVCVAGLLSTGAGPHAHYIHTSAGRAGQGGGSSPLPHRRDPPQPVRERPPAGTATHAGASPPPPRRQSPAGPPPHSNRAIQPTPAHGRQQPEAKTVSSGRGAHPRPLPPPPASRHGAARLPTLPLLPPPHRTAATLRKTTRRRGWPTAVGNGREAAAPAARHRGGGPGGGAGGGGGEKKSPQPPRKSRQRARAHRRAALPRHAPHGAPRPPRGCSTGRRAATLPCNEEGMGGWGRGRADGGCGGTPSQHRKSGAPSAGGAESVRPVERPMGGGGGGGVGGPAARATAYVPPPLWGCAAGSAGRGASAQVMRRGRRHREGLQWAAGTMEGGRRRSVREWAAAGTGDGGREGEGRQDGQPTHRCT